MEQAVGRLKISPRGKQHFGWAEFSPLEHCETPRCTTAMPATRSPPSPACPVPASQDKSCPILGSCLLPRSHPHTSSLAFQQLQSKPILPTGYDKLHLPKGFLRTSLQPESGGLTQHHPRQATNPRHFTGNRLDNLQSCITYDSQILSIVIPTQIPFEIIWISS